MFLFVFCNKKSLIVMIIIEIVVVALLIMTIIDLIQNIDKQN